ncbi:patatin-like phospholipase family protein [Thioalkalivibrio sulfidiphilus]|uniref:patatin-like phospholipase family protein n=1 Tax=Thioalkalivibrio sulfidiphilus TaxID=1033854 RepID=UPI000367C977|nr:patatin-like phospholipase family protein [Thioalkalivibrio sulfidiphilus]
MRKPEPGTFELGLVMAGAVSAGAYTAGVLDYLFEALEAWENAKAATPDEVPSHRIQIRVVTGTSAGGIASAITAMLPFTRHHPVQDLHLVDGPGKPVNANRNLLYRCWVRDVDLGDMLDTADIKGDHIPSLLSGDPVSRIANDAITTVRQSPPSGWMRWFSNPLQLYLQVTNLRGVPYLINMVTDEGVRGHRVMSHADHAHFAVYGTSASQPEGLPLGATAVNWPGTLGTPDDGWERVRDAALATSAFPVGLPARALDNHLRSYESRPWSRPAGVPLSEEPPRIAPDCPPHLMQPYQFWSVDGGLINNEPLETARIALAGAPDARNERDPTKADRAVLMIDPFPDDTGYSAPEHGEIPDMLGAAFALLPTLKNQARFKPEEVMLALHEDVYSRFLIVPRRGGRHEGETDIASAGLGGFAGFVDAELRMHDFQLGRRNAQKFLRDHLVVHRDNPIVADWVKRMEASGKLQDFQPRIRAAGGQEIVDRDFVQLIPLVGDARAQVPSRPWPQLRWPVIEKRLKAGIEKRAEAITPALVRRGLGMIGLSDKRLLGRLVRSFASSKIRDAVRDKALKAIEEDLKTRRLLR